MADVGERNDLHALLGHVPVILGRDGEPVGQIVVQKTNLHALGGLLEQKVPHLATGFVITKAVVFHVNKGLGAPDIFQEEFPFSQA